ncbi:hypothetical protein GCM10027569_31780 [Flindersiella endophytica]
MVIDVAIAFQAVPPGVAPAGFSILKARPPAPNPTAAAEDSSGGGALRRIRPDKECDSYGDGRTRTGRQPQ